MKSICDSITYLNCTNFIKFGGSICSTSSLKVLEPRCLSGRAHLPSKRLLFGCFHPCSKEDLSLSRTMNWWTNKPPNRTLLKLACRRTSSTCAPGIGRKDSCNRARNGKNMEKTVLKGKCSVWKPYRVVVDFLKRPKGASTQLCYSSSMPWLLWRLWPAPVLFL